MENSPLPRSLTILTRSSDLTRSTDTKESYDSLRRELSIPAEDSSVEGEQSMASSATWVNPRPTHGVLFMPPSSRPSTPPPDDESPSQIELIHGVGGCFPAMLSRSSTLSLSVNSGYEASVSSLGRRSRTPEREAANDDEDVDTPRAPQGPWTGPELRTPWRDAIAVQHELTPDHTPRPTRKRSTSPLSTPRPAKRSQHRPPQESLSASLALQDAVQPPTERLTACFLGDRLQEGVENKARPAAPDNADADGVFLRALPGFMPPTHTDLSTPSTSTTQTPTSPTPQPVKITIEWFSPDEIELQLSTLLSSYRSFHPDPDSLSPTAANPNPTAAERARVARRAFEALFGTHPLRRPGDDDDEGDFLLDHEEEDILDLFMTRIRDLAIPATPRVERYPHMGAWLAAGPLAGEMKGTWPFVRRVTLALESPFHRDGGDAAGRPTEGVMVWDFEGVNCGLEEGKGSGLPCGEE
ncbi:hypothetical protein QBC39DRAFT_180133 [Podospora conica]|nr:hypothetical protein QBC39DRAFT_180133 [Schizothecium conicum]